MAAAQGGSSLFLFSLFPCQRLFSFFHIFNLYLCRNPSSVFFTKVGDNSEWQPSVEHLAICYFCDFHECICHHGSSWVSAVAGGTGFNHWLLYLKNWISQEGGIWELFGSSSSRNNSRHRGQGATDILLKLSEKELLEKNKKLSCVLNSPWKINPSCHLNPHPSCLFNTTALDVIRVWNGLLLAVNTTIRFFK